jgi:hypothetical protein
MFLGITPVFSVSNSLYFLTLPLVSVMRVIYTSKGISKKFGVRVIYRKIRYFVFFLHAVILSFKLVEKRIVQRLFLSTISCVLASGLFSGFEWTQNLLRSCSNQNPQILFTPNQGSQAATLCTCLSDILTYHVANFEFLLYNNISSYIYIIYIYIYKGM